MKMKKWNIITICRFSYIRMGQYSFENKYLQQTHKHEESSSLVTTKRLLSKLQRLVYFHSGRPQLSNRILIKRYIELIVISVKLLAKLENRLEKIARTPRYAYLPWHLRHEPLVYGNIDPFFEQGSNYIQLEQKLVEWKWIVWFEFWNLRGSVVYKNTKEKTTIQQISRTKGDSWERFI